MGLGIARLILFLLVVSSVAVCLSHARSCGGHCTIGGGGASYDFLGDPAVNMDMSSPDDFVRENLGDHQTILATKSFSQKAPANNSSSLNQTNSENVSQNSTAVLGLIDSSGNKTSDNTTSDNATSDSRIVKLGASMQGKGLSTLVSSTFYNNMF